MRRFAIWVFLALSHFSAVASVKADAPAPIRWVRRLDEGLRLAKEQQKDVLINFTRHVGCLYCTLLEKEVFSRPEFSAAEKDFVLVELDYDDFPDGELKELFDAWQTQYLIHANPIVVLADGHGTPYAYTGYDYGITAASFLDELTAHRMRRQARDLYLAAAANAHGEARARHLHAAIESVAPFLGPLDERNDDAVLVFYAKQVEEIRRLDPLNSAGVRAGYDRRLAARDTYRAREAMLNELYGFENNSDAIARVDELLAKTTDPEKRWELQSARREFLERDGQYDAALALCEQLMAGPNLTADHLNTLRGRAESLLCRLGRVDEAMASCDRRIAAAANGPTTRLRLLQWKANLLLSDNGGQRAVAACREYRAATEFPSEDWQTATHTWALALQNDNQHQEAIERWKELQKASDASAWILLQIARNQHAMGSMSEAKGTLEQAQEAAKSEFQNLDRHVQRESLKEFQNELAELQELLKTEL